MSEFDLQSGTSYVAVRIKEKLSFEHVEPMIKQLDKHLVDGIGSIKILAFDFQKKINADANFFKEVLSFTKRLKTLGITIVVINSPKEIAKTIKDNGFDGIFKIVLNVAEEYPELLQKTQKAKSGQSIDVEFINPFIEGTVETLNIQCQMKISASKPFLQGNGPSITTDIAAVLGIVSSHFTGSVAICFPKTTFLNVINSMLGENYTEISKDCEDGVAELLNIIFGHAKRVLNTKGFGIDKAIPTIFRGSGMEFKHIASDPTIVLPFESSSGPFQIHIGKTAKSFEGV